LLVSLVIFAVNELLSFFMRMFSGLEKHSTVTNLNISYASKLTIGRFLNSSFVLLFVNSDPNLWFKNGNLVNDAGLLILLMVVKQPVKTLIDPWGWIKKLRVWYYKREGNKLKLN
jgi:hypothetical protein